MAAYNEKLTQMKASSLGGTAPGDEALSTAVREIGHNLPGNYSELLQDWGSWYTPLGYSYFGYRQPYPGGSRGILNVFFGLLPGDEYDLLVNYRRYKERIPPNLLPIADDPGGNLICLSLSGPEKGRVYFWDHEQEALALRYGSKPSYSNLYLLAESLDEFVNGLQFEQEQDENEGGA